MTLTARAGAWELDNVQVICLRCNQVKGALTAREFDELNTLLHTWPSEARQCVLRRLRAGISSGHPPRDFCGSGICTPALVL